MQAVQRQQGVLEVELAGMQEGMRGVLDLNRTQQVDLNARVDGLTHRITAAIASTGAAAGASPRAARGGVAAAVGMQVPPHAAVATSQVGRAADPPTCQSLPLNAL